MAWLTTSEKEGGPSRAREIEDAGVIARLPSEGAYEGLFGATRAAGLFSRVETGYNPLSWAEIRHWADLTDAVLSPSEFEDIRCMSETYVLALNEVRDKVTPPPWAECFTDEDTILLVKAASSQMDKLMGVK